MLDEDNFPLLDEPEFVPDVRCSHLADQELVKATLRLMQQGKWAHISTSLSDNRLEKVCDSLARPADVPTEQTTELQISREVLEDIYSWLVHDPGPNLKSEDEAL